MYVKMSPQCGTEPPVQVATFEPQRQGIVLGNCGYLITLATPQSPGHWRRFADALTTGRLNLQARINTLIPKPALPKSVVPKNTFKRKTVFF